MADGDGERLVFEVTPRIARRAAGTAPAPSARRRARLAAAPCLCRTARPSALSAAVGRGRRGRGRDRGVDPERRRWSCAGPRPADPPPAAVPAAAAADRARGRRPAFPVTLGGASCGGARAPPLRGPVGARRQDLRARVRAGRPRRGAGRRPPGPGGLGGARSPGASIACRSRTRPCSSSTSRRAAPPRARSPRCRLPMCGSSRSTAPCCAGLYPGRPVRAALVFTRRRG